jgi:ABC-2 type transport system ATP-binding protein
MSSTEITDESLTEGGRQAEAAARADAPVVLSVNRLSKTYPVPLARLKRFFRRRIKPPVEALRDVSFQIRAGEIFGLIGRNGAGKTTLLKTVATLVQPTSGTVTVNGFDSVRDDAKVRAQLGLASAEERSFYWRLTVQQNLVFFARLYGLTEKDTRRRVNELIEQFEMEELRKRRFGELSTGNKQRMAVARALLSEPPILLLDEPTRSLDPLAASKMRAFVAGLRHRNPPATVFLTSHNLAEIEELCERVAVISRGRIRALDTPRNLRSLLTSTHRVKLTLRGVERGRAALLFSDEFEDVAITEEERGDLTVAFTREREDGRLDAALRLARAQGWTVVACESEHPSLLEVLERYEREEEEESEAKAR